MTFWEKKTRPPRIAEDPATLTGLPWLGPRVPASGAYKADTFPVTWDDDDLMQNSKVGGCFSEVGAMAGAANATGHRSDDSDWTVLPADI